MSDRPSASVEQVQAAMERMLPDPAIRTELLAYLADAIEYTHERNAVAWNLAFNGNSDYLRLMSGWNVTVRLDKRGLSVRTMGQILTDDQLKVMMPLRDPNPQYGPLESIYVFTIPPDQAIELIPVIRDANYAAIRQSTGNIEKPRKAGAHTLGAIEYLERLFGRVLPNPLFASPSDRDASQVQAAMESAYPDPEARRLIFNTLVDSVELAEQGVPGCWTLTFLEKQNIRLTVGPNSTFFLGQQEGYESAPVSFSINLDALSGEDAALAQQLKTYEFHRPTGAISVRLPIERVHELLQRLLPAHHALIEKTRSGKAVGGANTPQAVIDYIESETGRELPTPGYVIPPPSQNAWKLSIGDKSSNLGLLINKQIMALEFDYLRFDANETNPASESEFRALLESKGHSWDPAPNHGPLQLYTFISQVEPDDRVYLYYDKAVRASGTVIGNYQYEPGAPSFRHRRDASLQAVQNAPLAKMTPDLARKLEKSYMALESLTPEQADEIDQLIEGRPVNTWQQTYARLFPTAGLHYTPWQQAVFFTALQTKGFVILSGISGTGKTKIAQAFSAALPQPDDERNIAFLTVRPDWRDSKSLIGYHNPITDQYERTPFLKFLLRAVESWEREDGLAWFVILDEMNLAHVEHYFAELLSILESGRDAGGWTNEAIQLPVSAGESELPASIKLPPNLFLIGTVNLDETTHAFSPKVLDRAFAMEFSEVSFDHYAPAMSGGAALTEKERHALLRALSSDGSFPRIDRTAITALLAVDDRPRQWLSVLNRQLQPHHMHFAYRVFDEIMAFVDLGLKNGLFADLDSAADPLVTAFDAAVLMKVLPKFHGSRARLEGPLVKMLAWCLDPTNPDRAVVENAISLNATPDELEHALNLLPFVLPRTAERATRLLWTTYVDGFAAFG